MEKDSVTSPDMSKLKIAAFLASLLGLFASPTEVSFGAEPEEGDDDEEAPVWPAVATVEAEVAEEEDDDPSVEDET